MHVSRSRTAAVAVLLVLLASCRGGAADREPTGGVPLTQRAVAAVAAEHLRVVPASARSTAARLGDPPGEVGAELGLPADGSGAGSVVRVVVSPEPGARTCRGRVDESGCTVTPTDGGVVRLTWDLLTPEEDPGYVAVSMVRDDGSTTVALAGPPITRDPRGRTCRSPSRTSPRWPRTPGSG
ncbi:hypothetical protein [Nocardioides sp. AX2bis]|uniref:hypothetical protein n=1 Tax=Nocardioides sp. AX2bis TaxID=2653157 RepID=UPI0012F20BBB|nr:hypothetical protein [Nocardioides sp. AX2bis]VXB84635.1 exported hypothetical protein [Nocardioides sp. AX2bis]